MEILSSFFFRLVSGYIDNRFYSLASAIAGPLASIFTATGAAALTVYLMLIGFRISTGDSRESMSSIVFRVSKMIFLFAILQATVSGSTDIQKSIMDIRAQVLGIFDGGGSATNVYVKLDQNLTKMAASMSLVNSVNVGSDVGIADAKSRALSLGMVGQSVPPVVAGTLVLINELGMRIAIMLSPIFIAAFMFKRTEGMFFEWVKFLITSTLSLGVLSLTIQIMGELSVMFFAAIEAFRTASDFGITDNLPQLDESIMIASFGVMMSAMFFTVPMMVNKIMASGLDYGQQPQGMGQQQKQQEQKGGSSNASNSYAAHTSNQTSRAGDGGRAEAGGANINTSYNNVAAQSSAGSQNAAGVGALGLAK
jgi:type IV secretion system protein VirB6